MSPGAREFVHEPTVVALESDGHDGAPGVLAERVDLDLLTDHARSGPSREEGEQFALLFAQAVIDSREDVDEQRLVDDLTADEMPEKACQHVLSRLPWMRELGWGQYVVPGTTAWIRSRADGDAAAPSRVEAQLVMTADFENDPELFSVEGEPMVVSVRVDVVRAGDVWLVADWGGPDAAGLDPGERPTKKWYGVGWRSWEPVVG
ncbi:hypothetical protein [Nocardioides jishulii]|uniref:Uncharacterized protein n=1 Tax=Nocardioides jishulii TaxID=2575440 RepID=A0A4U2YS96_9ACTN|nr:hypothetical protein [Nocardioides jishulii]QCX26199.1 hypothetical protein FCL41_00580 [Nocardioides jishulii]TKI64000.1 hypothetical protein FC770_02130 [Nocardioides jishulii]